MKRSCSYTFIIINHSSIQLYIVKHLSYADYFLIYFLTFQPLSSEMLNVGFSHTYSCVLSIAIPTIFVDKNCK